MPDITPSNEKLLSSVEYIPKELLEGLRAFNIRHVNALLSMDAMDRQWVGKMALATNVNLEVCREVLKKLRAEFPEEAVAPDRQRHPMGYRVDQENLPAHLRELLGGDAKES